MFQMMVLVSKYLYLFLLVLFAGIGYFVYWRKPSGSVCKEMYSYQAGIIVLFNLLSCILILLKEWNETIPWETMQYLLMYAGVMFGMYLLLLSLHRQCQHRQHPCKNNHVSHIFCKFWRNMCTTQQLLRAKNCTRNITFAKSIAIHNLGKLTDDKQSITTPLTCLNCFLLGAFHKFCNKKQHSYFTKSAVF